MMTSQDNLFHSYNLLQHLYEGVAKEEGVAYRWGNAHSKSELVRWSGTRGVDPETPSGTQNSPDPHQESEQPLVLPSRVSHGRGLTGGHFNRKQVSERRRLRRAMVTMSDDIPLTSRPRSGYTRRQSNAIVLDMMVKADQKGQQLDFNDMEYSKLDRLKQIDIVKTMPVPLKLKRKMRDRLLAGMPEVTKHGFSAWWYRWKMNKYRYVRMAKSEWREFSTFFTLWGYWFKSIEGQFGSGVLTYFKFLKWLFQLNVVIFILMFVFVSIPQIAFANSSSSSIDPATISENTTNSLLIAIRCTDLYESNVTHSAIWWEEFIDLLQGTGFMELTIMFYGYYEDDDLSLNSDHHYNLPLAYLLTVFACFLFSLMLIVHNTARGFKERLLSDEHSVRLYCSLAFASWDYSLTDSRNSYLKHCNIHREIRAILEEDRHNKRRNKQTTGEKCHQWSVRFVVNLFVISILCAAAYLIYYTTIKTVELSRSDKFATYHKLKQLLIEYMTSITITALNGIVPLIFKKVVQWEDFTPAFQDNYTLFRTVFLRLSSLAVLIVTLYNEVLCGPKDTCQVGEEGCTPLRCWETYVGQEIYKLVIMDFLATIAIILAVEFPRRLAVIKLDWKLVQMVGLQDFDIPKNVLDLIYGQTLLWLGMFFCPMIPFLCVVKFYIIFYLKSLTTLHNYEPSHKPYRASESQSFFMLVLMTAYGLCGMPVIYVVWSVPPSRGCGPYRTLGAMYDVVPDTVDTFTDWLRDILEFVGSAPFLIPLFVALSLAVYYVSKLRDAYKDMSRVLKDQLTMEGQDKSFLMSRLQELSPVTDNHRSRPMKNYPISEEINKDLTNDSRVNTETPPNVPLNTQ